MGAGKWTDWTDDVQNILILMKLSSGDEFTLESVYRSEKILEFLHSDNNHIKSKIRQQLQILRDYGIIQFIGRGKYKMN
jgi:type II restriction enzyme